MKWYFISPLILQKIIWVPTRFLLRLCGHIEISGVENLSTITTNVIFACNHASEMDVFLLPGSLPFFSRFSPIFYTSREQSFYKRAGWRQRFYGGVFFKAWGAYPVQVGLNDYSASLKQHIKILNDGGTICIFPEGRTTRDGNMQPAKGGVAYLSHETGLPVVPVYLDGTFQISPSTFFSGRRKLSISYGKPFYVVEPIDSKISPDFFKHAAEQVMSAIKELKLHNVKDLTQEQPAYLQHNEANLS